MSVFVLGHLNNKQKSILKGLIDVIIGKGKTTLSRFYINLSYIFLMEWRELLTPLLTYSIVSLLLSKMQKWSEPSLHFSSLHMGSSGPDAAIASSVHMETWGNYWANYPFSQISCLQQLSILDASEENIKSIVDGYAILCLEEVSSQTQGWGQCIPACLLYFESIQNIILFLNIKWLVLLSAR